MPETTAENFEIDYLDISAVGTGCLTSDPVRLMFGAAPSRARRLANEGDTIVSTVRTYLRGVWPVADISNRLVVSTGFAVLTPKPSIDSRFLGWVCQSNIFIDEVVARSNGVSYPAINASDIGDIRIPSPDNSIQRAIADYLDVETARIDAIISKKKQLMALAFERLEATLERIFSRWEQIPLRRLATRIDVGIAEAATHAYADDGVPLIRSTNIRRNRIDASDLLFIEPWFAERNRSKYVLVGDIVTVRTGEAGVSAVVPPELDQSQCFTQLITTLKPGYRPEIFCAALNCGDSRRYFRRSEWGSAQANISVPLLANAPVPNIPVSEQTAITLQISSLLRKADHIASSLKKQVELFQEHRQALVTAAVTGQLDLPEVAHGNH